jgi:hypothetical protein
MNQEFGMFTGAGEDMIYDFVKFANKHQLSDGSIKLMLEAIATNELFQEATDTVVRERVYASLTLETWR